MATGDFCGARRFGNCRSSPPRRCFGGVFIACGDTTTAAAANVWAVAAGIALAFALGARPTYLFTAGFVALLFALPFDRALPFSRYVRPASLPVLTPTGARGLRPAGL